MMRRWLCCATLLLGACDPQPTFLAHSGHTMGTQYRVSAACPSVSQAQLAEVVEGQLVAVNEDMSTYLPGSLISRFNAARPGEWFTVSPSLAFVVGVARTVSDESAGAFDVTVGPLVDLWGFGPAQAPSRRPTDPELADAMAQVGNAHLAVRESPPALNKHIDLAVDLSALAKGYGVDRVADAIAALGCDNYLVDVGGEVRVAGRNRRGQLWRVGVEVPDATQIGGLQRVLALTDAAVATSGDYRNFLELDGLVVAHTIDPRTGKPADHALASVTVVHPLAVWADAYATAILVLGPEAGMAFADQRGLAALLIVRQASGFVERYTAPMQQYLVSS